MPRSILGNREKFPKISNEQREAAFRDITSSEESLIASAAKVLSADKTSTDELVVLLEREKRAENRKGILYALSWHSSLSTWDLLVRILSDPLEDPRVRGQAAEGVAYMFSEQEVESKQFNDAVKALQTAARDPSPEVRYCAAHAIGSSGYLPLISVLEEMLNDGAKPPGWVGTVGDEAARSLEWIVDMSKQHKRR